MSYVQVLTLSVVILLVLVLVFLKMPKTSKKEHYDTYWNHGLGAQKQYEISPNPVKRDASKDLKSAELEARYTWSERDKDGTQLYDKYYNQFIVDTNYNTDENYATRDTSNPLDGYLDMKFENLDHGPLDTYSPDSMRDMDPYRTLFNGQPITLSQKNF